MEDKEGGAAILDEFLDGVDLRLLVVTAGTAYDKNCAIAGNFRFLKQVNGFRGVLILTQQLLELGIAAAAGIVDLVLAASGDEADGARGVLQIANERAGDAFFIQAFGFLLIRAYLNNGGSLVLYCRLPRQTGLFFRFNVPHMDPLSP